MQNIHHFKKIVSNSYHSKVFDHLAFLNLVLKVFMQVNVRFLDNLKLEAYFDDFSIIADQPIRYKGDGTAPGPYDYFLASSALCAAYFVKVYCNARNIPTDDIRVIQNNIVDPENRYHQNLVIEIELPAQISPKDKEGILKAMDRCTVKRVIQNTPSFTISAKNTLEVENNFEHAIESSGKTIILGKELSLEETIESMTQKLNALGIKIEIASWRNPIPHVWSVHIRDADSPMCYTNGKGSSKNAAFCSALGEYFERISNNYFYNDYFLGSEISEKKFVHYPDEKWFPLTKDDHIPSGLMDDIFHETYNLDGELKAHHLIDTNSGNSKRGICAIPFIRQSDQKQVYIPVNLVGNLYVSNGMSAGNTKYEARVQCLSEIFERAVKNEIIINEITLPDVPKTVLKRFPHIVEGIEKLEEEGFPIYVKDASLGGQFPVMCVTLMNPRTGGVFASFGAHPKFEVALERSLTELLQGRSFEGLNDVPSPTFNQFAITEHNNIVDHFIDSTGVISWKFFSSKSDYQFCDWNFEGNTEEEFSYLSKILKDRDYEIYIADYNDLGINACRILVPNYSEIYQTEDLIWDNNNDALHFRNDILDLHKLDSNQLQILVDKLEDSEIDNYTNITEIIGVSFEEASTWGQLTIGELKSLIYLALKNFEAAKELVELFLTFNDTNDSRRKYFQLLNIILDINLSPELNIEDYEASLLRMYGKELYDISLKTTTGEIRFYGLQETDMNFKNNLKHQKLIESYLKLHRVRENG